MSRRAWFRSHGPARALVALGLLAPAGAGELPRTLEAPLAPTSPTSVAAGESPRILQTQAPPKPDCSCRAQGRTFALGETICLRTGQGPRMAQCAMSTNVTSWQITETPCPES